MYLMIFLDSVILSCMDLHRQAIYGLSSASDAIMLYSIVNFEILFFCYLLVFPYDCPNYPLFTCDMSYSTSDQSPFEQLALPAPPVSNGTATSAPKADTGIDLLSWDDAPTTAEN